MWAGAFKFRHTNSKHNVPKKIFNQIDSIYEWFDCNLAVPRFDSYNGWRRFWFKPTAVQHIRKARKLAEILSEYYTIYEYEIDDPGNVVYEDEYQIAVNNRLGV